MKKPPALPPLWFEHVHNAPGGVAAAKGLRLHLDKMLRRGCWAAKGEERRSVEKGKGEVPRELTKDFDLRRQNFDQKYLDGEPSQRGWACDGATSQAIAGFELINALSEKVTMFSKSSLTNQKVQKWNKTIIVKHFLNISIKNDNSIFHDNSYLYVVVSLTDCSYDKFMGIEVQIIVFNLL